MNTHCRNCSTPLHEMIMSGPMHAMGLCSERCLAQLKARVAEGAAGRVEAWKAKQQAKGESK